MEWVGPLHIQLPIDKPMPLIRIIFLPFIIILAFFALMFLALCEEIYEWSGDALCFLSLHKWKYAVDSKSKLRDKFEGDCFYREFRDQDVNVQRSVMIIITNMFRRLWNFLNYPRCIFHGRRHWRKRNGKWECVICLDK